MTDKPSFTKALGAWYEKHHRNLPWRDTYDPYHIWLSEIMLQQTQVATVIDYYHRFLKRFPTIQALAESPEDAVLKAWEGLGYYARCRNLHKAAKKIMADYDGAFPQTLEAVEGLPGIGKSTAGAILTFAYGQRHPILDGNVKRVLSRLYDVDEDISQTSAIKRLWVYSADLLLDAPDAYVHNQAMMELGAVVCTPKDPKCLICPVQAQCEAFAAGTRHERPVKAKAKATPHFNIAVGVIRHKGSILIQKRPAEGLLGGLWEFPGGKQEAGETLQETVRREIAEELGIDVAVGTEITAVKHAYTHFKITLYAFECTLVSGTPDPRAAEAWQWVAPEELEQFAFPRANKKVLEKLIG